MSEKRPESIIVLISEVWRRIKLISSNHFFYIYLILIIVLAGTFGIWYVIFSSGESLWTRLLNNMNTINLVSFSVPLLATTIFDKLMVEKTSEELEEDCIPVQRWLKLGSLFMFIIITIFYGIGAGSGSVFSFWSFAAWSLSLLYWVLSNIENPNYSMNIDLKSSSGGTKIGSVDNLRRG
ncbi:TPA: hypothetical protein JJK36_004850 [Escherichia coli]|nr:hypothetical protein [Escherichia coli]HAW7070960.1 hypothetical protein [Escherichia coli]HAW7101594.1 hypothetical protein [Escherichia coli]HAW7115030.1 hypothetical protein [Escherichia coli]